MNLAEQVRAAGVVGAGGGGFPTHVKLNAKADTVIANGAECEPLLHKDAVVMERNAASLVRGLELSMEAVGAQRGVVGIKAKNKHAVEVMQGAVKGSRVEVFLLGDYYPAGDEYDLVYSVTERLIPPAGLPIHVGVVVNNVETLVNIAEAAQGRPVTTKTLTIAGAVKEPATVTVPLGVTYRDIIGKLGGFATEEPVLCLGGLMMGETTENLDLPVTKTATGVVVLPRSHPVIQRKLTPAQSQNRIGKSACDQCRYCTEYCPRFLLGYSVEPHQVMRSLGFTATGEAVWNQWAALCCSCGLCTLFACPEQLFPKEACDQGKAYLRKEQIQWKGKTEVKVHPMREGRRVPIRTLMKRLDVEHLNHPAPYREIGLRPGQLVLPLKQHAGAPAQAAVKPGEVVSAGQMIAAPAPQALGASLHAPAKARVVSVSDRIVLEVL